MPIVKDLVLPVIKDFVEYSVTSFTRGRQVGVSASGRECRWDCLRRRGLERRLVRSCPSIIGEAGGTVCSASGQGSRWDCLRTDGVLMEGEFPVGDGYREAP